jgi:CheY-like chemotaxis protein
MASAASLCTSLLIEDDADTREMYRLVLEQASIGVVEAEPTDAERVACSRRPDVVLMDLSLPAIDGFELASRLRANPETARIPILVISGHAGTEIDSRAREVGIDGMLLKPIDPQTLVDAILRLLHARQR